MNLTVTLELLHFACFSLWIDNMLYLPWVKHMEMSLKYLLNIL